MGITWAKKDMNKFFSYAMKTAIKDTTRALAGTAVAVGLEVTGECTYKYVTAKPSLHNKKPEVPTVVPVITKGFGR